MEELEAAVQKRITRAGMRLRIFLLSHYFHVVEESNPLLEWRIKDETVQLPKVEPPLKPKNMKLLSIVRPTRRRGTHLNIDSLSEEYSTKSIE